VLDEVFAGITAAGTLLTAGAVGVGVRQLRIAEQQVDLLRRHEQTAFEDDLSREYRSLIGLLPPEAFYTDWQRFDPAADVRAFYRYFDLSNEQLFLARQGRVSTATREQWKDGIAGNLCLPAFQAAWAALRPHLDDRTFEDLRELRRERRIPDLPA
jgi:hypothetical protein